MPKNSTGRRVGRPYKKGEGGRPLGVKNKFTTLKESFLNVYALMGGDDALLGFAQTHKPMFYQMITKLFPQDVQHSGEVQAVVKFVYGNGNSNGAMKE